MKSRIVVVEDSPTQGEALVATLEDAGFATVLFTDGESAVEGWRAVDPDLVISDIVMPGPIDGYQVCRAIKSEDAATPVVLLTSLSDPMDIIRGLECGADNFLTKPYDTADLIERIRVLLKLRESRRVERFSMGVKIIFMGREFLVTADREQILDMLLTTFEEAVKQNQELRHREQELNNARQEIARYARSLEARLERLADSIPDVLYSMTPAAEIVYVSKASESVFGLSPEQFSYETWKDRIHPDDRAQVVSEMTRAARTAKPGTVDYRFATRPDSTRWIRQSVVPIMNGSRSVERIDGIARDVTESYVAERRIRESEQRYRSLVTATSQIVWTTDPDGIVIGPLPTWQAFTGQTTEEVMGAGWADAVHPDDRASSLAGWRNAVENRSLCDVEHRIRRHDGAYRTFSVRGVPILGEDGAIREWVGTCTDITERRDREREVLRQRDYLTLLQAVTEACAAAEHLEDVIPVVLEQVCRLGSWGVGHAFVVNAESGAFVSSRAWYPQMAAGFEELKRVTEDASFDPGRGTVGRVAAERRPAWIRDIEESADFLRGTLSDSLPVKSLVAVPVVVGSTTVAVLEFFDREPKERDEKLLDVMHQVATQLGRVWERDRARRDQAAVEAQVRQAQKMEAVGRLAGGVAHDFNNILTVILSEAEFLQSFAFVKTDESAAESVVEIEKAGRRAAALTRQLLTFSRRDLASPEVLDPVEVVDAVRGMLVRLIGEDIDLDVSHDDDVGRVEIDRGHLEQVVVNLAVNARDAMPEGGDLTLEIRRIDLDEEFVASHPNLEPGRYVLIAVSDTGVGMSRETKERIFEPFFTTKEKGRGTGLGLATSFGIVAEAGGHIGVYSEVGVGTTMRIYLPCVEADGAVSGVDAAVSAPARGGTETILFVEDDPSLLRIGVRTLEAFGYTVVSATNGEKGLELFEADPDGVDLLLTDVVLPGMSGRLLADAIKEMKPGMKVLFTTGYTDDVVLRHKLVERGVRVLTKPYAVAALGRTVRAMLDE